MSVFLTGLLFETIYGVLALSAVVYFIVKFSIQSRAKNPNDTAGAIAALMFVIFLCTLPAIPRYQFESEVEAYLQKKPRVKILSQSSHSDMFLPLTWFKPPVNEYRTVTLDNPIVIGIYRMQIHRYGKNSEQYLLEVDCEEQSYIMAEPSANEQGDVRDIWGKPKPFKYLTDSDGHFIELPMDEKEYELLCLYDWKGTKALILE